MVAEHVVAVDPDGARLEPVGHSDGGVEVCGVDGGGKTVGGLVASFDDLVFSLELAYRADGAEDLLLHNLHVVADTGEDGWLDEVALVALALTTSLNLGARLLSALNVGHDSVELKLANLGTLEGVSSEGVTNDVFGCPGLELLDEFVVDAGLDIDTRTSAAALAVVEENAEVDPRDGVFDVGIVEDNVGGFAAQLKGDLLEVGFGRSLEDGSARHSGAGEGHLINVHVGSNCSTTSLAEAGEDVDNTGWEACLLDERAGIQTRQRGLLGRLQENGVTGGNGRADFPCPHQQWEVPRDDLTANADGLVSCVVE